MQNNKSCLSAPWLSNSLSPFQSNYLPDTDASLASVKPEYDVILALSLTKWLHLNWGDTGIKRFFKKVYRHLRPGGKFILEPQAFKSYGRRKHLTVSLLPIVWIVYINCILRSDCK